MRILVTGGTGFVGKHLTRHLVELGHEVTGLTRQVPTALNGGVRYIQGNPTKPGGWQSAVGQQEVIINLAGESIFGRWSDERKNVLRTSRILTTLHLVEAIPAASRVTLINASAVGYYGDGADRLLDETQPSGEGFLARLTRDWEFEASMAEEKGVRVIAARIGMVLGKDGGALPDMVLPFRYFLGGTIGDGSQWISWIHVDDLVAGLVHLATRPELAGPFNLVSPHPVTNRDFVQTLGRTLHRPVWFSLPGRVFKTVLGEFGTVFTRGQRAVPQRLLESGFSFQYETLDRALGELVGRGSRDRT